MVLLGSAILALPFVSPGWTAATFGAAVGAAHGSARAVEAAILPRLFGTTHLGAIRGVVLAGTVAGSAFGPILLAVGFAATGSYLPVLFATLALPAAVTILAFAARSQ